METNKLTDEELINLIKKNDKEAFRVLYDRYYKILLGTAINILKDVDSGKDAVQEVFIQFWKKREDIAFSSSIKNYLKRSVINRSLNQIKAQKRFDDEPMEHEHINEVTPDEQLATKDLEKVIENAIESIPERGRLVYKLRRQEDLSLKEIAEKLDISPKTVENQLTKALKILKNAVRPFVEKMDNS